MNVSRIGCDADDFDRAASSIVGISSNHDFIEAFFHMSESLVGLASCIRSRLWSKSAQELQYEVWSVGLANIDSLVEDAGIIGWLIC